MMIAEMVKQHRVRAGISQEVLAEKLRIPAPLLALIEDPSTQDDAAVALLAGALNVPVEVFTGKRPPEPTEEEKRAAREAAKAELVRRAKYPRVRAFLLDADRCRTPDKAAAIFADQEFSLPERNVVLYLSTTALYHFCDTNTSNFSFDQYLFGLHDELLVRYEAQLDRQGLSPESKEERMDAARSNVFVCDTMANIAIRVLDGFAAELEEKLVKGVDDFAEDLELPLSWGLDEEVMRITFYGADGEVKDEVNLLDVKERR